MCMFWEMVVAPPFSSKESSVAFHKLVQSWRVALVSAPHFDSRARDPRFNFKPPRMLPRWVGTKMARDSRFA